MILQTINHLEDVLYITTIHFAKYRRDYLSFQLLISVDFMKSQVILQLHSQLNISVFRMWSHCVVRKSNLNEYECSDR